MSTTVKTLIPLSRQREKPWPAAEVDRQEHHVDPRLLTGQGRGIDDIDLPNMLHKAEVRSTRAHALPLDRRQRRTALKGVVKVLTGADIARTTGPPPCFSNPPSRSSAASPSTASATSAKRQPWWWPRAATWPRTRSI